MSVDMISRLSFRAKGSPPDRYMALTPSRPASAAISLNLSMVSSCARGASVVSA